MPNKTRAWLGRLATLGLLIVGYFALFPEDLEPFVVVSQAVSTGVGVIIGAGILAAAIAGVWLAKTQEAAAPESPPRPLEVVKAEAVSAPAPVKAPERPRGKPMEVLPADDDSGEAQILP